MIHLNYVQIIYLFSNFFRVFALNLYLELFFSKKNLKGTVWSKRFILAGYFLINSLIYLLFRNSVLTLLSNTFLFFVLTIPYKSAIGRRSFAVCSIFVLGIICEGITGRSAMWLLKDQEQILVTTYIISNFLLYLIVLALKKILQEREKILLPDSHWIILIIVPVVSSVADIVLIFGGYKQSVNVIVILSLFTLNIIFFYLFEQMVDKYAIGIQNQALLQQNKAYQQQISLIRRSEEMINRIKHDYINHTLVLKSLLENNCTIELKKYLASIEKTVTDQKPFVMTGNTTIDGLINYKLSLLQETGINVEVDINIPQNMNLEGFDGVVILGNLMDNAIRALQEQKEGSFLLELRYDRGVLFLHMRNSYIGIIRKKGAKLLTTKMEVDSRHGIGLSNVKTMVEKYNGDLDIITDDGFFNVIIVMYI